jgi:Ca-activated chloride channel family protein
MMDGLHWEYRELVHLFWPAMLLAGLIAWRELRQARDLEVLLSEGMQRRLVAAMGPGRRISRVVFIFGALCFSVLALMGPRLPGSVDMSRTKKISADIVVALDVSKSMLAEDAAPNRLARAKAEISKMLGELVGDRVALVAFAGKATLLAPLTPDFSFVRMMLGGASPSSVSRGGTALGEAIRTSLDAFDKDGGSPSRMIILITDGEDQESMPEEAAKAAKDAGVKIVAIGLGSVEGTQILITDPESGVQEVVKDSDGKPVISKIDEDLLRKISVELTDGVYIPAKVNALDLKTIVEEHIDPLEEEAEIEYAKPVPALLFQWMVLGALLCMIGAVLASIGAARRENV